MRAPNPKTDLSDIDGELTSRQKNVRLRTQMSPERRLQTDIDFASVIAAGIDLKIALAKRIGLIVLGLAAAGGVVATCNRIAQETNGKLPTAEEAAEKILGREIK